MSADTIVTQAFTLAGPTRKCFAYEPEDRTGPLPGLYLRKEHFKEAEPPTRIIVTVTTEAPV